MSAGKNLGTAEYCGRLANLAAIVGVSVALGSITGAVSVVVVLWREIGATQIGTMGWVAMGFGVLAAMALRVGLLVLVIISGRPERKNGRFAQHRSFGAATKSAIDDINQSARHSRHRGHTVSASWMPPTQVIEEEYTMSTITARDCTEIYYKDWGTGPVVVFSHGWPLNADAWDGQMLFLVQNGYRCIAHDRRGHGRSSQSSNHNDMNGYADDLATLIEALDLRAVTLVGHSTGGGEVARYIGQYGTRRVKMAVLIAAVPPIMLRSPKNPEGLSIELFDRIRAGVAHDRSQYYKDLAVAFYGANQPGAKVSQGTLDQFWLWSMQAGAMNAYESIKAFSETDFTEDLKKFDVPTLVLHGEDDQIVPVNNSARKSARLIKGATEIYYPGAPHGLTATHQEQVNADLLAFIERGRSDQRNSRTSHRAALTIGGAGFAGM